MEKCFLQGYGTCGKRLSREHYISEAVLKQLASGKTVALGGLPWQPERTLQSIGIGALQARILCEGHNSALSPLDEEAGRLLRTLDAIDKSHREVAPLSSFDGQRVERWLLKIICGLVAGQGLGGAA